MAKKLSAIRRLLPVLPALLPIPSKLVVVADGRSVNVVDAIEDVEVRLSMDHASTLTVRIADPDGALWKDPALDADVRAFFRDSPPYVDEWRLWRSRDIGDARREEDVTVLTFWDAGSAALKRVVTPLSRSASSLNWEGWVRLNASQAARDYRMSVVVPRPNSTPPRETGEDAETTAGWSAETRKKVTVKGAPADAEQLKNMDIAFARAVKEKAPALAVRGMGCAGTSESGWRAIMNTGGSKYGGVFQGNVGDGVWDINDTDGMAKSFLLGGKGFQAGGAIKLAREVRGITPGAIATRVEASGKPASFYDVWAKEATRNIELWSGMSIDQWRKVTGPAGTDDGYGDTGNARPTEWRRGRPGENESALKALSRDAEGLGQRAFVAARRLVAARDQDLILAAPHLTLDMVEDPILATLPSIEPGSGTISLQVEADQWGAPPGAVVEVTSTGGAPRTWLVQEVTASSSSDVAGVILQQPTTKIPKPPTSRNNEDENELNTGGDAPITAGSLAYPCAKKGTNLGGPAAHKARAWGNWQSDNAIDIGVPIGTRLFAVDDGTVEKLGGSWNGGQGNPDGFNLTLKTGDNAWFYTHISRRVALQVGQKIKKGDYLGLSGAANGVPHLHIGCRSGDPEQLLWSRARARTRDAVPDRTSVEENAINRSN